MFHQVVASHAGVFFQKSSNFTLNQVGLFELTFFDASTHNGQGKIRVMKRLPHAWKSIIQRDDRQLGFQITW